MNRDDFEHLSKTPIDTKIYARSFLSNGLRRHTLLYGYTCDRDSFHVYLEDGYIHRFVYRETEHTIETIEYDWFQAWDAHRLVPDKRVYPESTALLMAHLLRGAGIDVPYTTFDDDRYECVKDESFHGLTKTELG